jgi:hypothetical protein
MPLNKTLISSWVAVGEIASPKSFKAEDPFFISMG